jgi:hypothetical protein
MFLYSINDILMRKLGCHLSTIEVNLNHRFDNFGTCRTCIWNFNDKVFLDVEKNFIIEPVLQSRSKEGE